MYNRPWQVDDRLAGAVTGWLQAPQAWSMRPIEPGAPVWAEHGIRYVAADEVAADLLDDPRLQEALGFLSSKQGQVIEETVLGLGLNPLEARLLTEALTIAWKTVLDQRRPIWQRAEVLVVAGVVGLGLLFFGLSRKS